MNTESINLIENPSDFAKRYFTKKTLNFVKIDSEVHQFYEKPLELFSNRPVLRRRQIYQITPAVYQFYENPPGIFAVQFFKKPLGLCGALLYQKQTLNF